MRYQEQQPPEQHLLLRRRRRRLPRDPRAGGEREGNAYQSGTHLSTTRLLVGADYLVGANVSVGARLGYAFNVAPRAGAGAIHAEGRVAYWFGSSPFAKTGIRPYAAVMGGMAEMDTKFTVPNHRDRAAQSQQRDHQAGQTLTVWRKGGPAFAGLAAGAMIPLGSSRGHPGRAEISSAVRELGVRPLPLGRIRVRPLRSDTVNHGGAPIRSWLSSWWWSAAATTGRLRGAARRGWITAGRLGPASAHRHHRAATDRRVATAHRAAMGRRHHHRAATDRREGLGRLGAGHRRLGLGGCLPGVFHPLRQAVDLEISCRPTRPSDSRGSE